MLIYANLVIPILFMVVLLVFYKVKVVWWEHLLLFGVALIAIFLSKIIIEKSQTTDTEYWGGYVVEARYYEAWDEEVPCTHSYDCMCGTDSEGNSCCCSTCYYHAYDVDHHPEYWQVTNSNGKRWSVKQSHYNYLVKKFNIRPTFKNMNRDYHSIDGDMYFAKWPGSEKTLEPTITKHRYENRIRVSSSIYALEEPDTAIYNMYGLYHYPSITGYYDQKCVLGYNDTKGERQMQILNALNGSSHQFKSYILVFKNQPRDAVYAQEQQWQGTNKNEFVICIGINNSNEVQWSEVLTWSDSYDMRTDVKVFVEEQDKLDISLIANKLDQQLKAGKWKRKEFEEFSYLKVEPSTSSIMWTMLITTLICLGIAKYSIANEFEEDN